MRRNLRTGFMVTLVLFLARALGAQQGEEDVAVIVNPENPATSISSAELRKIFAGEKQSWSRDLPVTVFVRAPQAYERDILLKHVLKMSESEYQQHWVKKTYSGEAAHEPAALPSNGVQLEGVRSVKGSIALIRIGDIRQGVKILKVDGRLPGTPGYSLK